MDDALSNQLDFRIKFIDNLSSYYILILCLKSTIKLMYLTVIDYRAGFVAGR